MNIFEGSRRVAYCAALGAVSLGLFYAVPYDPYISVVYSVSAPNKPFVRMTADCPSEAGRHYFSTTSESGDRVSITLCLLPMEFGDQKALLIPYKVDSDGSLWGARSYSSDVSAYGKTLEARFSLPREDDRWIKEQSSREYWDNWKSTLETLAIGLSIFAFFVLSVGWIVRGFMGIPRGLDKKPDNPSD